jgi:hypothetical protein
MNDEESWQNDPCPTFIERESEVRAKATGD